MRLNRVLWAGVLAGPLGWALHELGSYMLTETACVTGRQWLFHPVALATLLIPLAGALLARRAWERLPAGSTEEGDALGSRSRFMALTGMILSAFFCLVILAQWIPSWILGACAH
jgi:hypothetical protein